MSLVKLVVAVCNVRSDDCNLPWTGNKMKKLKKEVPWHFHPKLIQKWHQLVNKNSLKCRKRVSLKMCPPKSKNKKTYGLGLFGLWDLDKGSMTRRNLCWLELNVVTKAQLKLLYVGDIWQHQVHTNEWHDELCASLYFSMFEHLLTTFMN